MTNDFILAVMVDVEEFMSRCAELMKDGVDIFLFASALMPKDMSARVIIGSSMEKSFNELNLYPRVLENNVQRFLEEYKKVYGDKPLDAGIAILDYSNDALERKPGASIIIQYGVFRSDNGPENETEN